MSLSILQPQKYNKQNEYLYINFRTLQIYTNLNKDNKLNNFIIQFPYINTQDIKVMIYNKNNDEQQLLLLDRDYKIQTVNKSVKILTLNKIYDYILIQRETSFLKDIMLLHKKMPIRQMQDIIQRLYFQNEELKDLNNISITSQGLKGIIELNKKGVSIVKLEPSTIINSSISNQNPKNIFDMVDRQLNNLLYNYGDDLKKNQKIILDNIIFFSNLKSDIKQQILLFMQDIPTIIRDFADNKFQIITKTFNKYIEQIIKGMENQQLILDNHFKNITQIVDKYYNFNIEIKNEIYLAAISNLKKELPNILGCSLKEIQNLMESKNEMDFKHSKILDLENKLEINQNICEKIYGILLKNQYKNYNINDMLKINSIIKIKEKELLKPIIRDVTMNLILKLLKDQIKGIDSTIFIDRIKTIAKEKWQDEIETFTSNIMKNQVAIGTKNFYEKIEQDYIEITIPNFLKKLTNNGKKVISSLQLDLKNILIQFNNDIRHAEEGLQKKIEVKMIDVVDEMFIRISQKEKEIESIEQRIEEKIDMLDLIDTKD